MSKKTKKRSTKKLNLKPLFIIVSVFLVCGAIGFGIAKKVTAEKAKILDVAFYNLPENLVAPLKEKISAEYSEKINFVELTEDQFDVEKISKNYDLFFSWNGSAVNQLSESAKKIPGEAYSYIVQSLVPENGKYLPLFLDHWEMAYYIRGMQMTVTGYPRSLENLSSVLDEMKEIVFVPMYCSGGNDKELWALISAFTESMGGNKAYNSLVKLLSKSENLDEVLDVELDSATKTTLRSVLDIIKEWQTTDLLYRKWIYAKDGELINLAKQRQIGVFFTSLSKHRTLPLSITEGYAADRFPLVNNETNHGLIGNEVVCVKLSKSSNYDSILTSFVVPDYQYQLSKATQLGPVGLTCQSYDRQADDVRYLAAVSSEGVSPDIANAVFQTNSKKMSDFAESVRNYLK